MAVKGENQRVTYKWLGGAHRSYTNCFDPAPLRSLAFKLTESNDGYHIKN
jgi:hypothetical protein